jgi:hypothetical protein
VRGTPASGKTTLALLLKKNIEDTEQRDCVTYISSWDRREVTDTGWLAGPGHDWKSESRSVLIIDEAQMSYWDFQFWNTFVKGITTDQTDRVILLASYANPAVAPGANPVIIPLFRQITLRPIDHDDGLPSAGLLLTRSEYTGLRIVTDERFDQSLIDGIFHISGGHVGAIRDLVEVISRNSVGFLSIY